MAWRGRVLAVAAAVLVAGLATPAAADPLPGFDLDPDQLAERMDACLAYQLGEQDVLMGWISYRTGETRHWRCSSLRHMWLDVDDRKRHDPYVDVAAFMRCADKVVSYGFPRTRPSGEIRLNYQYNGTKDLAYANVNPSTGDVISFYTRIDNDWVGCANGL
jgi:hypothetical protein